MTAELRTGPLLLVSLWIASMVTAACQSQPTPEGATSQVVSGRAPNASISGAVTYREGLALSPDTSLVVEVRDVSFAGAAAPLIASQTISTSGQVPIDFRVECNREDIYPRNTYAISARIVESDGRLAFTNDTAYEVITRGNPDSVDMAPVMVQPPHEHVESAVSGSDGRTWIEVPAPIVSVNLIPNEPEHMLRIVYLQSTVEGCVRPGIQDLQPDSNEVSIRVTLFQPPPTAWAIPCDENLGELDTVEHLGTNLQPGESYRVIVNDAETTAFTIPREALGHTVIAESPKESVEVV